METKHFKTVGDKISKLSRQPKYKTFSVLKKHPLNNILKVFQAKYVIVTIDKSTNNDAFTCPGFG